MTPDELRDAIKTLWPGHGGQTRAAQAFGIGDRRIREYLAPSGGKNSRPVPEWLANDIRALLAACPAAGANVVDPRRTVLVLIGQMQEAGFTPTEAASAILGAAVAEVRTRLGHDFLAELLKRL